jgi:hypothetical protein
LGSAGTDPNKIRTPFLFNLIPKQELSWKPLFDISTAL